MSIKINREKCAGCGACAEICPGNLIHLSAGKKAVMEYPRDCWGCTSCLKVCKTGAISYYLGADIGGLGSLLGIKETPDKMLWTVHKMDGSVSQIEIDKKISNRY